MLSPSQPESSRSISKTDAERSGPSRFGGACNIELQLDGAAACEVLSHEEACELIKTRLRVCWWGPRATHNNAALLSSESGTGFARAKEWDEDGALGWAGDTSAGESDDTSVGDTDTPVVAESKKGR